MGMDATAKLMFGVKLYDSDDAVGTVFDQISPFITDEDLEPSVCEGIMSKLDLILGKGVVHEFNETEAKFCLVSLHAGDDGEAVFLVLSKALFEVYWWGDEGRNHIPPAIFDITIAEREAFQAVLDKLGIDTRPDWLLGAEYF